MSLMGIFCCAVDFLNIFILVGFRIIFKTLHLTERRSRPKKVAIIGMLNTQAFVLLMSVLGGGIAGHGCAFALQSVSCDVELFERNNDFGGNAKTVQWPDGLVTGLSVLAWPVTYFRNYCALLKKLDIRSESVELPFYLSNYRGESFAHCNDTAQSSFHAMNTRYAADMARWNTMVEFVKKVNMFFTPSNEVSLYHMSILNPLNVISLRFLSSLFRVSSPFWHDIIVPLYASSFLTIEMDHIPSVILPVLTDLIPLTSTPVMHTWSDSSRDVFEKLALPEASSHPSPFPSSGMNSKNSSEKEGVSSNRLLRRAGHAVAAVVRDPSTATWTIHTSKGTYLGFDTVVYASNSRHVLSSFRGIPPLERALLQKISYTDDRDTSFVRGIVHSDMSVLPEDCRSEVMSKYANFIQARKETALLGPSNRGAGEGLSYENTFVLSSWLPSVKRQGIENSKAGAECGANLPRFVTYGHGNSGDIKHIVGVVENICNHPQLDMSGLLCSQLLRFVQGGVPNAEGVYYCGSFATPGNGHDLSLCSGIAVAMELGAKYPFDDAAALRDFQRLQKLMGFTVL